MGAIKGKMFLLTAAGTPCLNNALAALTDMLPPRNITTAVNAAVTLGRPILIKGEPGTGKTPLAEEIAHGLGRTLLQWHVKSTTKAQQGLYEYDAVARFARLPTRRRAGSRHQELHHEGPHVGGLRTG